MASPILLYTICPLKEAVSSEVVSNPPNKSHIVSCHSPKRCVGATLSVEMVTKDGIDASKYIDQVGAGIMINPGLMTVYLF